MPSRPYTKRPRKNRIYTDEDREMVRQMKRQGRSNLEIARRIRVTPRTLTKHFAAWLLLGDPKLEAQLTVMIVKRSEKSMAAARLLLTHKFGWGSKPSDPKPRPTPLNHNGNYDITIKPGRGQYVVADEPPDGWTSYWPPEFCITQSQFETSEAKRLNEAKPK